MLKELSNIEIKYNQKILDKLNRRRHNMGRVAINPKALKWARIDAGYNYSNLPNKIQTKI